MLTSIRLSKLFTAPAWIFPAFDVLCQGEPESLKHNFVTPSLLTAFFASSIFLVNSISFAAASESQSHQLISNVKITLFLFWETALDFPQSFWGLRFPIFRWVQLPHPSNLLLCLASHNLLIIRCVSSAVQLKFRTSLRYNGPKRGCEKEEGLEDLYFFLWKLESLKLEMILSCLFLPRL